jgi:AAA ATPase domain
LLRGRESEAAILQTMLEAARDRRSRTLVVRGQIGIGKTAFLDFAVQAADGFLVLRARGVQSESELPFAGLQELLAPVHDLVPRLIEWQGAVSRVP